MEDSKNLKNLTTTVKIFQQYLKLGKLVGLRGSEVVRRASDLVEGDTGTNVLQLLGLNGKVLLAENSNFAREDHVQRFLETASASAPGSILAAEDFYKGYQAWMESKGLQSLIVSQKIFGKIASDHYGKEKSGTYKYQDVSLTLPENEASEIHE